MKKTVFLYSLLLICGMLLIFFAASIAVTSYNNHKYAENTVINYTLIYADIYQNNYSDNTNLAQYVAKASEIDALRITVIDSSGVVLADSSPVNVTENHLLREEIQAAQNNASVIAKRHSETLNVEMIYYAVKVESGAEFVFIRAAIPVKSVNEYIYRTLPLLALVLLLVILLSALLGKKISQRLLVPLSTVKVSLAEINGGIYKKNPLCSNYEEVNSMLVEINDISERVNENIAHLILERSKLNYILNNINDGLFAIDHNEKIILINEKLKQIFGITTDIVGCGVNYLTFSNDITAAISNALAERENAIVEFNYNNRIYLVTIKSLSREWVEQGKNNIAVIILSDITEGRQNQKLREDFFANASHELKTPLTVIKGFNELLSINNKNPELNSFIEQINKETSRMISLISDMLKLSELENLKVPDPIAVNIELIARDAINSLMPLAIEKNLTITAIGQATIMAETNHIYELIKNLLENAIKYNKEGGSVRIDVAQEKNSALLTITDTGIGIDTADQSRIFERFYRVEKSRSRISGGTGLGLSIVKHICALYGASLNIKSKLNVGTTITVEFLNKKGSGYML
ncbi:MAG: PAS domain S-box protein [Clostridia bacterium]|nr:PAS domain S-box protein [Clostridia bacterium]